MPRVRIVADYCSRGYQLLDEAARAAGELAIPDALEERLRAWNDYYDSHYDPRAFDDPSGIPFDFVAFAREGLAIAKAVKRELPHWTVIYRDVAFDWYMARDPRSYDPKKAEYEISFADALADGAGRHKRFLPT
jgi:hypothetical protein